MTELQEIDTGKVRFFSVDEASYVTLLINGRKFGCGLKFGLDR